MKTTIFKKIIPTLLIAVILFTGFFGVVGVGVVDAAVVEVGEKNKEKIETYINTTEKIVDTATFGVSKVTREILTNGSCSPLNLKECVNNVFALIGDAILGVFSLFVGIAGWVLDKSVTFTIIEMGDNARKIGAIEEGWKVFRDLSNIVIIFVLLIIGIATILRIEGYNAKSLLAKLIIVALFINFSLFFTQVVIDSSNLISLQFYNNIRASGTISEQYMNAFKLTTLYNTNGVFDPQILVKGLAFYQIFLVSILGSVVFLVVAFALLAGAFLLISRFVVLVFLMILAPLAFVSMVLPSLSKHSIKWWSMLMSYAFFAPTYMILTWFVLKVVNSPAYKLSIGLQDGVTSFSKIGVGGATAIDSISIIFNFIIIIAFIIASVLLSNYMGIKGSATVMSWGESARKWGLGVVGRNTIGRGSRRLGEAYDSAQARMTKTKGGRIARSLVSVASLGILSDKAIKGTFNAGEGAKFGSGVSFAEMDKKDIARRKEVQGVQKEIEQKKVFKKAASGAGLTADDIKVISEMRNKELEKIGIKQHLENKNVAKYLSAEQLESITKSDEFTQQEIKNIKRARFEDIVNGVNAGNVNSIKDLRSLSDKEVEMLGDDTLRNDYIIKAMSQSQISGIKKSGRLNSTLKTYIINRKTAILNALTDPQLEAELRDMKPSDVSKINSTVAIKPAASRTYSPAVLIELAKELSIADRQTIRTNISNAVVAGTATQEQIDSHNWLNVSGTPSGVIF